MEIWSIWWYTIRKQVYVMYNSLIKEPTLYQGTPLPSNYHWSPVMVQMVQNLGSHKFNISVKWKQLWHCGGNTGHKLIQTGSRKADLDVRPLVALLQYTAHAMVDSLSSVQSMTETDTTLQHKCQKGNQKKARGTLSTHAHYSWISDASTKVIPECIVT